MIARPCLGYKGHCSNMATLNGRCDDCRRRQQAARNRDPRRVANYGVDQRRWRARLEATLPELCAYCGRMIEKGDQWVAAHLVDGDPDSLRVVAHPRCNELGKHHRSGAIAAFRAVVQ